MDIKTIATGIGLVITIAGLFVMTRQEQVEMEMLEMKLMLEQKKISKAEIKRWKKAGMKEFLQEIIKLLQ